VSITRDNMAKKKDPVYERPIVEFDPTDARQAFIDPRLIYGFPDLANGDEPVITDHPDYSNPRGAMDQELITEIIAAGDLLEPVTLYIRETGDDADPYEYILLNGKTRLTAVAQAWATEPTTDSFQTIPFIRSNVDSTEARRFTQLRLNMLDRERPLTDVEIAEFLMQMEDEFPDLTEEDQLFYLYKANNNGNIRWLREIKKVAESPTLAEAVKGGEVDMVTAKKIAKTGTTERAKREAVAQVKKEKASGKTEAEARKAVAVTKKNAITGQSEGKEAISRGNKTTLVFQKALDVLSEYWKAIVEAFQRDLEVDEVDFTNKIECEDYIIDFEMITRYRMFVIFFKLDLLSLREQFEQINEWLGPAQLQALRVPNWLPGDVGIEGGDVETVSVVQDIEDEEDEEDEETVADETEDVEADAPAPKPARSFKSAKGEKPATAASKAKPNPRKRT